MPRQYKNGKLTYTPYDRIAQIARTGMAVYGYARNRGNNWKVSKKTSPKLATGQKRKGAPTQTTSSNKKFKWSRKRKQRKGFSGPRVWPKTQKRRIDYNVKGVVSTYRNQMRNSCQETGYIGHTSFLPNENYAHAFRVLAKELFRQANYNIDRFDVLMNIYGTDYEYQFASTYWTSDANVTVDTTPKATTIYYDYVLTDTVDENIWNWCQQLNVVLNQDTKLWEVKFLKKQTNQVPAIIDRVDLARVKVDYFTLDIFNSSTLKMQNVTTAADNGDEEFGTELEADNIFNNPISYKTFERNNTNGIVYKLRTPTTIEQTKPTNMIGDRYHGNIWYDPVVHMNKSLYNCPTDFSWSPNSKKIKSAYGNLQPGEIKYSKLFYKKKIGFNNFMKKMNPFMNATTGNFIYPFGNTRVFAVKMQLRNIGDPTNIRIDSECDHISRMSYTYRPKFVSQQICVAPTQDTPTVTTKDAWTGVPF